MRRVSGRIDRKPIIAIAIAAVYGCSGGPATAPAYRQAPVVIYQTAPQPPQPQTINSVSHTYNESTSTVHSTSVSHIYIQTNHPVTPPNENQQNLENQQNPENQQNQQVAEPPPPQEEAPRTEPDESSAQVPAAEPSEAPPEPEPSAAESPAPSEPEPAAEPSTDSAPADSGSDSGSSGSE
jgi:hypothetical protein